MEQYGLADDMLWWNIDQVTPVFLRIDDREGCEDNEEGKP
jgi:hypothetical protein